MAWSDLQDRVAALLGNVTTSNDLKEVPVESRNKYGADDWDTAVDDLAGGLGGTQHRRTGPVDSVSASGEVDEDFLREARNPRNKYGET
jgi:hypothetical protein